MIPQNDLCEKCGEKLEQDDAPTFWFSIPFTKLEVWRWEKQTYCLQCACDEHRREHDQIYDAGAQDGYEAGLRDGRHIN